MLLLSKNSRYIICWDTDFKSAVHYDIDVTDSGVPVAYFGGSLFKSNKFNQPIGGWDMSEVVNIEHLFQNSVFNQPINRWNVVNVQYMHYMFHNSKYNHPLDKWDVSSVQDMQYIFTNSNYNYPLGNWNVRKDAYTDAMFENAAIKEEYKPRGGRDVAIE